MSAETMKASSSSPWPSLGEAHGGGGRSNEMEDDDWELLENSADATSVTAPAIVIDTATDNDREETTSTTTTTTSVPIAIPQKTNPKMLHHCASSPDFRQYYQLHTHEETDESVEHEEEEDDESHVLVSPIGDENASTTSSFTLVSNPAAATTSTASTENNNAKDAPRRVPSFRDALLLQKEEEQKEKEQAPKEKQPQQPRLKPKMKFVVKPISRRVHSAGDLQNLGAIHEHDDEAVMGDSDAMEFYHRKSKGACGRSSGMRLRPDEAKRKEMIIHKKNAQRARQGR
mmetsp:Transcript_14561/g.20573  ORF Transcript_14561/g.20573 Transcript_14561/m.20573 type:complete len:287 (-) Transcript_14561:204-1064(-)